MPDFWLSTPFYFGSTSGDCDMENFICNCIAALMSALAVIALAVMVCGFGLIVLDSANDGNPMFNCNIVESSNGVQNE